MADSAFGIERSYDSTAYSPIPSGSNSPGARTGEGPAPQTDLASLIRAGTLKQESGNFAEAAECFRLALDLGDRTFGADNPDLIILLNDLTRLYLKQAAYGSAEPLLLRLLELKRNKGEDHPEVATVLASLATVRQALGNHESAEQLWRRVLDIRERTLAPNHFATASALEHLGDALAARGKIREALTAFQRALTIREKTLGGEHPSLRVARERIADLQLQSSDDMLEPIALADMPPAAERYRLLSPGDAAPPKYSPATVAPAPQIKLATEPSVKPHASEQRATPKEKKSFLPPRAFAQPPKMAEPEEVGVPETVMMALPLIESSTPILATAAPLQATALPYRDTLESIRDEMDDEDFDGATLGETTRVFFTAAASFIAKRRVAAAVTVAVLATGGVAWGTTSHAFGDNNSAPPASGGAARPATLAAVAVANPIPVPASNNSTLNAESSATKSTKTRATEEHAAKKAPEVKKNEQPARVAIPALSTAVLSRLDSVAVKAANVSSKTAEAFNLTPAPMAVTQRRATFQDDQSSGPQRARLIGELPTPKVPASVMDVEGEVRVRFNVDSLGNPLLDTFAVVSSPNPLLTAAVRKAIPGMRFEPARTAGPDSHAIGDVVQIGFQFARSR